MRGLRFVIGIVLMFTAVRSMYGQTCLATESLFSVTGIHQVGSRQLVATGNAELYATDASDTTMNFSDAVGPVTLTHRQLTISAGLVAPFCIPRSDAQQPYVYYHFTARNAAGAVVIDVPRFSVTDPTFDLKNYTYPNTSSSAPPSSIVSTVDNTARGMAADAVTTADGAADTANNAASLVNQKVAKAGDAMSGPLNLYGNPTANLQAAPKQYVDQAAANATDATARSAASLAQAAADGKVDKSGDAMSGPLTLPGNPTANLQAAPKQYVDQAIANAPGGNAGGTACNLQFKDPDGKFGGDAGTCTDGNGNVSLASVVGKYINGLAMAKQLRSSSSATDGCQNGFSSGYTNCYIEPGYTTDAGIVPTSSQPEAHITDHSYAGDADTYLNTVIVGSVGQSHYSRRRLFSFDNKMAAPHGTGSYDTRPAGETDWVEFVTRGRNDNGGNITQWSSGVGHYGVMENFGGGIHNNRSNYCYQYGVGDFTCGGYDYMFIRGGLQEYSGEGGHGYGLQVVQPNTDEIGTISVGGTAVATVKLAPTRDGGTAGVGHFLVNKQAATYSGNVISSTVDAYGLIAVTTDATFTPSQWIGRGTVPVRVGAAINQDNPPSVSFTVATTTGDGANVSVGDNVCFAPKAISEPEELKVSSISVSGSTVTISVPTRRGADVGPITIAKGACSAFDAVGARLISSTGMLNPIVSVGYPDAHTVLVGYWEKGLSAGYNTLNTNHSCPGTFSQSGTTVSASLTGYCAQYFANNANTTVSGTTDFNGVPPTTPLFTGVMSSPQVLTWTVGTSATISAQAGTISTTNTSAAFNIWPMAIIYNVCNKNVTTAPTFNNRTPCVDGNIDLETNSVVWSVGDAFEVPHYMAIRSNAMAIVHTAYTPNTVNTGISLSIGGEGYNGTPAIDIISGNTNYLGSGGRFAAPPIGFLFRGPNSGTVVTDAPTLSGFGPNAGAIMVYCAAPDTYTQSNCSKTPEYWALWLSGTAGVDGIKFRPTTGDLTLSAHGLVQIDSSPVGLYKQTASNVVLQQKNRPAGLFFDTTSNHFYGYDSGSTGHQLRWRDDAFTAAEVAAAGTLSNNTTGNSAASSVAASLQSTGSIVTFSSGANPIPLHYVPVISGQGTNTAIASWQALTAAELPTSVCYNTTVCSGYQASLGYTPVTQGGGAGQGTNKVYIGWSGSGLKAQVDGTDLGTICFVGGGCGGSTIPSGTGLVRQSGTTTSVSPLTAGDVTGALGGTPLLTSGGFLHGDLDLGGYQIHDLADPSSAQDAVTRHYLDNSPISGVAYSDVTGSFNFDADNTNTTGHRVRVYATGQDNGGSHSLMMNCLVDGNFISASSYGASTDSGKFTVQCEVPNGSTWHITTFSGLGFTAPAKYKIVYQSF